MMASLRAELHAAPTEERATVLAGRQISPAHVRALGATLGLKLTRRDLLALRTCAAEALRAAEVDLDDPSDEELTRAGEAMRSVAAEYLARRRYQSGESLTVGRGTLEGETPSASDWRWMIAEHWHLLPVMSHSEVAQRLTARRREAAVGDHKLAVAA
jgi:hypothetical protein